MSRLLTVLLLTLPLVARAQIVNVQARFAAEPEPGLHGGVSASADWRSGSVDILTLRAALTGHALYGRHLGLAFIEGEYARASGEKIIQRTMEHLRYRYDLFERLALETFLQHELNEFRRINLRALAGAGPRTTLVRGEHFTAALGLALMVEREHLRQDGEADAGRRTTELRLSSYAVGQVEVFKNLSLAQTVYVQPRVDRFADVRLLNQTALTAKANENVGLTLSLNLFWDRAPPASVPPLETALRTTLAVSF